MSVNIARENYFVCISTIRYLLLSQVRIRIYYTASGVDKNVTTSSTLASYLQVLSRKLFKWREEDEVLEVLRVLPHVAE